MASAFAGQPRRLALPELVGAGPWAGAECPPHAVSVHYFTVTVSNCAPLTT